MTIHHLKQAECFFDDSMNGNKPFEIRKNDRKFEVGDIVVLEEWDGLKYTTRKASFRITYVLSDTTFGMKEGYVILGLKSLHRRYS